VLRSCEPPLITIQNTRKTGNNRHFDGLDPELFDAEFIVYISGIQPFLKLGCLCPVVVHNDYVVLDRHTHNTFTGTTILL
jgi:hypothetical protein